MERYLDQFNNCMQNEEPFCRTACPFNLDVLDFIEKMGRNSYNAAYKTLRNAMVFPDIMTQLCHGICEGVCPRTSLGGSAVRLNLLEKTCVARASKKEPVDYNLPSKSGKVAVIGGGISGLTCALKLAEKKYNVTLYEKTDKLGGKLHKFFSEDFLKEEFDMQLKHQDIIFKYKSEIKSLEELYIDEYDCIYVATGRAGEDFGILTETENAKYFRIDKYNNANGEEKEVAVFAGGELTGYNGIFPLPENEKESLVYALAVGFEMNKPIEAYLKVKKLGYIDGRKTSRLVTDIDDEVPMECMVTGKEILTDDEVKEEVKRCLKCHCNSCKKKCDLINFYKKQPLIIKKEVTATIAPSESFMNGTPSIRLINTCTGCEVCKEVCPSHIEMGEMLKEARKKLHKTKKMPRGYHQYWLYDMAFANSEAAAVCKDSPSGNELSEGESYAFFPGCQLGATDPEYVISVYKALLEKRTDTKLLLRCCGIHSDWSGDEEAITAQSEEFRRDWQKLGSPILIAACPTCIDHIRQYLPEVEVVSVYEIMRKWEIPLRNGKETIEGSELALFDPCKTGDKPKIRDAVRNILEDAGIRFEDLENQGCCSYGGQSRTSNPKFGEFVANKRENLSDKPYIAYCINCRDIFLDDGKPCMHIFDLMLGRTYKEVCSKKLPDVNQRRENRMTLKQRLLKEFWNEEFEIPVKNNMTLIISEDILRKMNEKRILKEDVCNVIELAEKLKRRIYDPKKGTYTCFRQLGNITVWVEYRAAVSEENTFEIINVYSHMVQLELEEVWNGRKTDFDLR